MEDKTNVNLIIVNESKEGPYTREVIIGEHRLTGDESVDNGGNDSGPSPYDFLLTALGTCTSMTVRTYAKLKQIPLKNIIVRLSHQKIHADDCVNCEEKNAKIDKIEVGLELQGDLTSEQMDKLLEIANMCPVYRTLTSKILINTQLVN